MVSFRLIRILIALAALLAIAAPVAAHNAGPCNDAGLPGHSDYATHHVVALAHAGDLGNADHDGDGITHVPGTHQGYSFCDPSA